MDGSKQISLKAQRGVSLSGLIVVFGIIIAVAIGRPALRGRKNDPPLSGTSPIFEND